MATKKKAAKKPAKKTGAKKTGAKKKAKKKAAKKPAAKKKPKPAVVKKTIAVKKPMTKSEMIGCLAEQSGLTRGDASSIMETFLEVIGAHLKKSGPGMFVLPGFLKFQMVTKPATPAKTGINPFTGQPMMIKAKPARRVVKVRALKKLKAFA